MTRAAPLAQAIEMCGGAVETEVSKPVDAVVVAPAKEEDAEPEPEDAVAAAADAKEAKAEVKEMMEEARRVAQFKMEKARQPSSRPPFRPTPPDSQRSFGVRRAVTGVPPCHARVTSHFLVRSC